MVEISYENCNDGRLYIWSNNVPSHLGVLPRDRRCWSIVVGSNLKAIVVLPHSSKLCALSVKHLFYVCSDGKSGDMGTRTYGERTFTRLARPLEISNVVGIEPSVAVG
ncbi:hypothetical protein BDN71DRAFT_1441975 [Pleurotus eryngii]|uniref:Uncharacterized protein n=1 Tax=Pleurotus eryngii TaxID=5323 RepID=A0A9P6DIR5_PLEER|nr:hypothetical protein BDN71DRAFT_1441975 [Pleurotus eryngii]